MIDLSRGAAGPFFVFGIVVLVVASLSLTRDYAVPIAIAVLIWALIDAFAASLRRVPVLGARIPLWAAKLVAVLALFGVVTLAARIVAHNVGALGQVAMNGDSTLIARARSAAETFGFDFGVTPRDVIERLEIDAMVGWALRAAQSLISDVSLVFLYVLFLLLDERFYDAKMRALFPDQAKRRALEANIQRIGGEVRLYLWLMFVLSSGVALSTYVFAAAVGLDGAGFWASLAFALNFIPTIGSIAAVAAPVIYGLLTLDDPVALAVLIGGLSATQAIAGEIVLPRLMGDRLNLSSFVILLALVIWGAMWGPAGMFLAIPITVILVMICAQFDPTRPIAILLSKDGRLPDP